MRETRNEQIGNYVRNLGVTKNDEFCLWNATKYLKLPTKRNVPIKNENGEWCRTDKSKAETFALHLNKTFRPHNINDSVETNDILNFLDSPCPMDWPINHITPVEVREEIKKLNCKKSPGYDCIDAKVVQSLSKKSIILLTLIFNSILRLNHFPTQWKCAEVVMICKPGKPENAVTSYRPISLLVTFSKIFEKNIFEKNVTCIRNT